MAARYLKKIQHYRSSLGMRGAAIFVLSKILGKPLLIEARVPGIRHSVHLRVGTTDASVLKQVLVEKHYELPIKIAPKVIVDAGANIGLSAVYFANRYPDADIVALEPEASNFELLQKNAAPYPRIRPLRAALWKENRSISLVDPHSGHHGFRTVEEANGESSSELVDATTLDALMKKLNLKAIDLLKIDIEGSEKEVFESSEKWINEVGMIMAELHDDMKPGCSKAFMDATKDFPREFSKGETLMRLRAGGI